MIVSPDSVISIALVNYINARPFAYGLENSSDINFNIIQANPAECASLFANEKVDIALIPVGALHELHDFQIITDYCIGCDGEVRTVCLFSNEEINEIHTIYLDDHSRTSVLLAKLIVEDYYGIKPEYINAPVEEIKLSKGEAKLMIGDKVFTVENEFNYKYDLGSIWKEWQDLPFAFAVWVSKLDIDPTIIAHINKSLTFGLNHVNKISSNDGILADYFSKNISYNLTNQKRQAIELYLSMTKRF